MTVRGHQLAVDWSKQGTYANTAEDVSSDVLPDKMEISWGRDVNGEVTLDSTSGRLGFALRNTSRAYSPEYASSPIFGKVLPGCGVRYQVTHLGTIYTLLQGVLDDFDVDPSDPAYRFTGEVLDGWGRPGGETLSTPLYRDIRTGTAIGLVLDAIGWTGGRDIDPGLTVMPWWWEEGTDANTAIRKIVNSEGPPAIAYVEGGTFVFKDRYHRLFDPRSVTSQGLYTHIVPAGTGPAGDFKVEKDTFVYNHGIKAIVNTAAFSVDVRAPQLLGEVWASEDPLTIAVGATADVVLETTAPFMNAVTPEVDVDIIVLSGSVSAVSLSRTSGQSCIISITAASDAVISRIALRANSVAVTRTVQVSAVDQSSVGQFETKKWPDDSAPVWAGPYDAQAIADRIVAVYATYRPRITFTVPALDDTYLQAFLQTRISDRITVRNDIVGVNGDFMVERITHTITNLGMAHRLTITCSAVEPVQPTNVFTFNVAGKGFNDGLFGTAGIFNPAQMFVFDTVGQGFNQGVFAN